MPWADPCLFPKEKSAGAHPYKLRVAPHTHNIHMFWSESVGVYTLLLQTGVNITCPLECEPLLGTGRSHSQVHHYGITAQCPQVCGPTSSPQSVSIASGTLSHSSFAT